MALGDANNLVKSFEELINKSIDQAQYLTFEGQIDWHRYIICLYCTIVEYCDTLVTLTRHRTGIGIPIVSRAITEAYIDLKNICADENYAKKIEASFYKQWLSLMTEARTGNNPFLSGMANSQDFEKDFATMQGQLNTLRSQGINEITIKDKFIEAGMEQEYRSVYNFLCADAHNNLRSLVGRHIKVSTEMSNLTFVMFDSINDDYNEKDVIWCHDLLNKAGNLIHSKLSTGKADAFLDTSMPEKS